MFPWNMLPFSKDMKESLQKMKPDEINNYVQDLIGKMMPNMGDMMNRQDLFNGFQKSESKHQSNILNSSTFETHDYVFVRIPIRNEEWLNQLRLYYTSNQLIIEHIPDREDSNTITLPAIVKRKGATANFKDGVLEIKIPKNIDMQYSQIDVTEIL
ncbi:Hsp20/alpha crystallin family protein [Bacillus sp. USDA818B3_A]|uniref:Hsp20/alpha crystallin family protein n=1 Tax=Bacillus sp. USDA818B3_A TaxID=2698834 RepID=UPI00136F3CBD|nr:Hsp20/alpha crystallin family protein [Bacillus sp. USDA818B3_A]